jgi:hypothetical protein
MATAAHELPLSARTARRVSNPFTILHDPAGFIRVAGAGLWSPTEIDRHFVELGHVVRTERALKGRVRVLVDLRGAGTQSPETAARIGVATAATYRSGDRVAIVVGSSLAKMQLRRIVRTSEHEFFVSPEAAATWLMAYN